MLSEHLPPWRIEEHDELPSTQDTLRERLATGASVHSLVLRATTQTAGRGQRARDWLSSRGGSWQTACVRDESGQLARSPITLLLAVSLARTFQAAGVQLQVKWPNDLLYGRRKAAGILCEAASGHLLIGIGVNVHNPLPAGAAALTQLPLAQVHDLVLQAIRDTVTDSTGLERLVEAYAQFDALKDRKIEFQRGREKLRGTASGIDANGNLLLNPAAGAPLALASGRVRLLH